MLIMYVILAYSIRVILSLEVSRPILIVQISCFSCKLLNKNQASGG